MDNTKLIIETVRAAKKTQYLLLMVCKSDSPDIIIYDQNLKELIESIRIINEEVKMKLKQLEEPRSW